MAYPELPDPDKLPEDPSGNERWFTRYASGSPWDLGRVEAVEEPCEFHRQQAIDLKLKRCVKCKTSLAKYLKRKKQCDRCRSTKNLEEDHVVRRADGGSESKDNKRWLCRACHNYRHARDGILKQIEKFTQGNSAQLTMWIYRLGVLELLNTPQLVRERGYQGYWTMPETHYSRWYENIKTARKSGKEQAILA